MARHDDLHANYVADLRAAKQKAETWWEAQLARSDDSGSSGLPLDERWPFGPTSHPAVIKVIREYFVACQSLNIIIEAELDDDDDDDDEELWGDDDDDDDGDDDFEDSRPPPIFLFEDFEREDLDLQEFLSLLVMLPVGTSDYIEQQEYEM